MNWDFLAVTLILFSFTLLLLCLLFRISPKRKRTPRITCKRTGTDYSTIHEFRPTWQNTGGETPQESAGPRP